MTDWIDKAFDIKETKRPSENMFSDGLDIDESAYQSILRRISRRAFCQSDGLILCMPKANAVMLKACPPMRGSFYR